MEENYSTTRCGGKKLRHHRPSRAQRRAKVVGGDAGGWGVGRNRNTLRSYVTTRRFFHTAGKQHDVASGKR
jgi:hypothetical protein